jgi:hypothetical protein
MALVTPSVPIPFEASIIPTTIIFDSVVALVQDVKSIRELGYELFLG